MAETKVLLEVAWENNVSFEINAKEDDGPVLAVIKTDENGSVDVMWPALTDVVERYIKALMARIGKEMTSS